MARSIIYPMSVLKFVDVILEETAGQVVLEYVEAIRYPEDPFFRGGVLALTKLGGAEDVVSKRVFVISNDIVPSLGMPVAAPGLRVVRARRGLARPRLRGQDRGSQGLRGAAVAEVRQARAPSYGPRHRDNRCEQA